MSTETSPWSTGTVAILHLANDDLVPRVTRTHDGKWRSIEDDRFWEDGEVSYVHRMVVLAPEASAEVARLSNVIRKVDGKHSLGASELAEAILAELAEVAS